MPEEQNQAFAAFDPTHHNGARRQCRFDLHLGRDAIHHHAFRWQQAEESRAELGHAFRCFENHRKRGVQEGDVHGVVDANEVHLPSIRCKNLSALTEAAALKIALEDRPGVASKFDKSGPCGTTRQRLDSKAAASGKDIQDTITGERAHQDVEELLLLAVHHGASALPRWGFKLPAPSFTGDDSHGREQAVLIAVAAA